MTYNEYREIDLLQNTLYEIEDLMHGSTSLSFFNEMFEEIKVVLQKKHNGTKIKIKTFTGGVWCGEIVKYIISRNNASFCLNTGHYRNHFNNNNTQVISEEEYNEHCNKLLKSRF